MFLLICCLELACSYNGNHEGDSAVMHRSSRLACISCLPACILNLPLWRPFWDVFLFWFFPLFFLFFSQRGFWRGFIFPWACWPRVLNKFGYVGSSQCFDCVSLYSLVGCFYLLCCTISARQFLHVAQSFLLICNGCSLSACGL